jgi:hypothetical protein
MLKSDIVLLYYEIIIQLKFIPDYLYCEEIKQNSENTISLVILNTATAEPTMEVVSGKIIAMP